MNAAIIQEFPDAGLITDEQRQKFIEHFQLKGDDGGKFQTPVEKAAALRSSRGAAGTSAGGVKI